MKKHLQFMSIHEVHFSYSPMFCLSGVPLCGQGAWWIRQTPSGLGCSLVLMKIKSMIFQKIKRSSFPEWRLLLPSLLSAWWSAWESSSMSQAWPRNDVASRTQSCEETSLLLHWISKTLTLELILVRFGVHFGLLPRGLAERGSGKTQEKYSG